MGHIQYTWHIHAQACFCLSNPLLRGLQNRISKKKSDFQKTSFIYPYPSPPKFHSGITFLLPILFHQPAVKQPNQNSPFLPSCSQLFLVGKRKQNQTTTSKLNQSPAQACSLHFVRSGEGLRTLFRTQFLELISSKAIPSPLPPPP